MNRTLTFTSAVVVTALSLAALPAAAQDRRESGHQRGGARATASQPAPQQETARQAVPRQAPRETSAPVRQAAPRAAESAPRAPESRPYVAPQAATRAPENRSYEAQPRAVARPDSRPAYQVPSYSNNDRRGYASPAYGNENRHGYAAPAYRGYAARPYVARPYFSRPYVRPFGWVTYHSYRFSRPYYSFSPWLSLGWGLWIGTPVPYPWGYMGNYQPRVFGDYPDGTNDVTADQASYGGASFDIQPSDADLFVDGEYVGTVGDFGPDSEPLTLAPGPHRIAIEHDGFRPMEWDVTVEPGQVIPYRGVLDRQ